ncbi:uncharacterized protein LOC128720019 [Anopheles nili]|uniref:uncharacterized protein LOC128720019 n=1 Tax=Anopheles nili TaxID=185578 RepID=UPI00237A3949|nr:uncharacterized protein LOC128720019 [Anopheles nili]
MSQNFFKLILVDPSWDVRTEAKKFGLLDQLFIDRNSPTDVYIKYKYTKNALQCKASMHGNPNVLQVVSLDEWNIKPSVKAQAKSAKSLQNSSLDLRPTPKPTKPEEFTSSPKLLPLMWNSCTSCRREGALFQCFVCGALYCGEMCQQNDWQVHRNMCMPRLVRVTCVYSPPNANNQLRKPPPAAVPDVNQSAINSWGKDPLIQPKNEQTYRGHASGQILEQKKSERQAPEKQKQNNTISNVPTNVLKNLAMKRRQDEGDETVALTNGNDEPPVHPVNGVPGQNPSALVIKPTETGMHKDVSSLLKRMQLKAAPTSKRKTIQYAPFPEEGDHVKITYISDAMLYIYKTSSHGALNGYLNVVKRSIESARSVKEFLLVAPKQDDIFFAPFDEDYYRAVVKSVDGANVTVFYPDFGNTHTLEWKLLKEIPDPEIKYATCYTHVASIDGVSAFSPPVFSFLNGVVDVVEFELTKVGKGQPENATKVIDMRHAQELYLLSEKIKELASKEEVPQAAAKYEIPDPASYVPVSAEDIEENDLPTGKDIELIIVEASDLQENNMLCVVQKADSVRYAKLMNDCDRYGNSDPNPYIPEQSDHACLVKFEELWCRAMPIMLTDDGVQQCYLLDIGIARELEGNPECRRYPPGLERKIYVNECFVDNPEVLGVSAKSAKTLLGKTIKAKVNADQEELTHITILSISE